MYVDNWLSSTKHSHFSLSKKYYWCIGVWSNVQHNPDLINEFQHLNELTTDRSRSIYFDLWLPVLTSLISKSVSLLLLRLL